MRAWLYDVSSEAVGGVIGLAVGAAMITAILACDALRRVRAAMRG